MDDSAGSPSSSWPSVHPELLEGDLQYIDFSTSTHRVEDLESAQLVRDADAVLGSLDIDAMAAAKQERARAEASANNPFTALERMLEARINTGEGRVRGGGRSTSRGGSLRDGAGYSSSSMMKNSKSNSSFNNLQRCGSQSDVKAAGRGSAAAAHPAPIGVHCGLEENGEVVCRDTGNNVVLLSCSTDSTGAMMCTMAADNQKFKV